MALNIRYGNEFTTVKLVGFRWSEDYYFFNETVAK